MRFDDDIRRLQSPPTDVAKEDAFVRRGMNGFGGNRFILVRGDAIEELLERQELLQERLRPLLASGGLSSIQSLAPFLPSLKRQQEDRQLLHESLSVHADQVRHRLNAVGLAPDCRGPSPERPEPAAERFFHGRLVGEPCFSNCCVHYGSDPPLMGGPPLSWSEVCLNRAF